MDAPSDASSTGTQVEASSAPTPALVPTSSSPSRVDPKLPTSFDSVSDSVCKPSRTPSSTSSTFDGSVPASGPRIILQPSTQIPTPPVLPPPHRRPPPPMRGILKPPKQAPKGVFASLISRQPRDLVGSLGARLMGETPYSQGAADTRTSGQLQHNQSQQQQYQSNGDGATPQVATTAAGAFFSKAFEKLNMAATMTLNNIQSTSVQQSSSSDFAQNTASASSTSSEITASASNHSLDSSTLPARSSDSIQPERSVFLKRASFHLPSISVVYPILSALPPYSESVAQSREEVEAKYLAKLQEEEGWQYWSSLKLLDLYERACRARDEGVDERIWRALKEVGDVMPPTPRVLDLTGVNLPRFTADALSDVLAIEWGLSKLVLDDCDLFDDALKSILHALLHSQSLPTLSIRSNRRLKTTSWKIIAVYLTQAQNLSLRDLDISDNTFDKKSVDALAEALVCPKEKQKRPDQAEDLEANVRGESLAITEEPGLILVSNDQESDEVEGQVRVEAEPKKTRQVSLLKQRELDRTKSFRDDGTKVGQRQGLETLRVDGCVLRANALESLAQAVRSSNIRNISLRRNKINSLGGVAVALMIKDYPDTNLTTSSSNPFNPSYVNPSSPSSSSSSPFATADKSSGFIGKQASMATTYTPYTPRSRRKLEDLTNGPGGVLPTIPLVVSNSGGGITSRTMPEGYPTGRDDRSIGQTEEGNGKAMSAVNRVLGGMMQSRVRSLDDAQRIGNLVTLDLKGNDLRGGVTYIAQVLKRNRTLKMINLAENRIDVLGLAALAEALKYNSTLDTLDLNHNPCSGPGLEGINGLRTSFTLNTNLKRLFLADTGLTTEGAIALAEFFPEARHLLHLDLTMNQGIEVAGIMALAVGLRSNRLMRCLDLSIPFNNEDVATLSQDILQSCIRNTELAQERTTSKASRAAVWGPIQKSTLARIVKEADTARAVADGQSAVSTPAGKARLTVYEYSPTVVITRSEELIVSLDESVEVHNSLGVVLDEILELIEQAKALRERLEEMIQQSAAVQETQASSEEDKLQVLLGLVDRLTTQLSRAERAKAASDEKKARLEMMKNPISKSSSALGPSGVTSLEVPSTPPHRGSSSSSSRSNEMAVSPNFSIAGDSDDENESEPGDYQFPIQTTRVLSSDGQALAEQKKDASGGTEKESRSSIDSLTDKKRTHWIEEEGEVFRKGVLLGAAEIDEDESEHLSGEQLRKELLDTPVDRSTRRLSSEGLDTSPADLATDTTTTTV